MSAVKNSCFDIFLTISDLKYFTSFWMEGLECKSLAYEVVIQPTRSSGIGRYIVCKRFAVETLLWSLEFMIQIKLEPGRTTVWTSTRSWSQIIYIMDLPSCSKLVSNNYDRENLHMVLIVKLHHLLLKPSHLVICICYWVNCWDLAFTAGNHFQAGNYLLNVNNRNIRTRCEICSKLTIKIPERRQGMI